jgi:hypothetical protein
LESYVEYLLIALKRSAAKNTDELENLQSIPDEKQKPAGFPAVQGLLTPDASPECRPSVLLQ